MGQFEQDFKNYERYQNGNYFKKSVPDGLAESLSELLANVCVTECDPETSHMMASVTTDLLVKVGKQATTNWDIAVLKTEIKAAFHLLCEG